MRPLYFLLIPLLLLPGVETLPAHTAPESMEWPIRVRVARPAVTIVEESRDAGVYRTEHFEFRVDTRLSRGLVAQFGEIFEATLATLDALPLGLDPKPLENGHFQTRLFTSVADYHEAGGLPGSGGTYQRRHDRIIIPLEHLGVRPSSSGFTYDRHGDNSTLIHEITHQVMRPWLGILPTWLTEGMAVWMETVPFSRGTFQVRQQFPGDYLAARARTMGHPLPVTPVEELMTLSHREWNAHFGQNVPALRRNYHSALTLTHFFLRMDGDGDGAGLAAYLRAVRGGMAEEAARDRFLLRGRSFEELETEMIRAYGRRGVRLTAG